MDTIKIAVRPEVFERLQKLAVPLVDDADSVIERLINHWEKTPPKPEEGSSTPASIQTWRSSRGEAFPVGLELRAHYLGNTYTARVTSDGIDFGGKFYDSPSSAGNAVKCSAGTRGRAALTNGWEFWEMLDPETNRWISIDVLRRRDRL